MNRSVTFHGFVQRKYGTEIVLLLKEYEWVIDHISNYKARRIFLLKCQRERITPRYVQHKALVFNSLKHQDHPFRRKVERQQIQFERMFLNTEIDITCWLIDSHFKILNTLATKLRAHIEPPTFNNFMASQEHKAKHQIETHKTRLSNKLNNLRWEQKSVPDIWFDEKCIVNLTTKVIPEDVRALLSFGQKFAVKEKCENTPFLNVLADVEHIIRQENTRVK